MGMHRAGVPMLAAVPFGHSMTRTTHINSRMTSDVADLLVLAETRTPIMKILERYSREHRNTNPMRTHAELSRAAEP